MRLKDYARSAKKRKEYVQQRCLLMAGVDVSKARHDAYIGTQDGIIFRKFEFPYTRDGFKYFEDALRKYIFRYRRKRVLFAMEPSGIYWYALFDRLKSCGYAVSLVNYKAVKNNRKTMQGGKVKRIKRMHTVSLICCSRGNSFPRLNGTMN